MVWAAVLRATVAEAAEHVTDEAGFFTRLRAPGVLVRERFSEVNPLGGKPAPGRSTVARHDGRHD